MDCNVFMKLHTSGDSPLDDLSLELDESIPPPGVYREGFEHRFAFLGDGTEALGQVRAEQLLGLAIRRH